MIFGMDLWRFVWIHVCGLWVVGCKKPNPRINSYGIKSMESFL